MEDAFLAAHFRAQRFFDIGGPLAPISIRDQMIRGSMLAERIIRQGLAVPGGAPLVIVGAGAAGASAAMFAGQHGLRVYLVERAAAPFTIQARASSRWVDPNQYDWPLDHWAQRSFPWDSRETVPIQWEGGFATDLASGFWNELRRAYSRVPDRGLQDVYYLTVVQRVRVSEAGPQQLRIELAAAPPDPDEAVPPTRRANIPSTIEAAAVVFATGVGTERVAVTRGSEVVYTGPEFWGTDLLNVQGYGIENPAPRIVIGGSGDGSIQDFLRVVTRSRSANDIYRQCAIPLEIERRIHSIEDRAKRSWLWAEHDRVPITRERDHRLHTKLEAEFSDAVAATLDIDHGRVRDALQQMIVQPPDVKVVHRCQHLSCYYPLNRFLGTLIAEFLRQEHGMNVFMPGYSIIDVQCLHPPQDADGNDVDCYGLLHDVYLQSWPTCSLEGPVQDSPLKAEILLIRHGLLERTPLDYPDMNLMQLKRKRQLLPYAAWV